MHHEGENGIGAAQPKKRTGRGNPVSGGILQTSLLSFCSRRNRTFEGFNPKGLEDMLEAEGTQSSSLILFPCIKGTSGLHVHAYVMCMEA